MWFHNTRDQEIECLKILNGYENIDRNCCPSPPMSLVVFPGRFHNPSEEIVIGHDVIPPLSDDIQLTVEEYRNKLYEVRSVSLHPIGRQNKFNVFITMATEMENKQAVWCP